MIDIDIRKELYGSNGIMKLDVELHIKKGEFIALMGQSGSGKTTLLRVLAGLEESEGDVVVEGLSWSGMTPQLREIGFVFQDYALFDNMSVEQNLLFVNRDKLLAQKLLDMTELTALARQNVKVLSGGQKQRVSLCRAMMKKPKLLLMDEPLSALDTQMRSKLQKEIKQFHSTFGTTTIMVSHDAGEVYALADRVCVMEDGEIVKDNLVKNLFGKKEKIYKAEVLKVLKNNEKTLAMVFIAGELMEIEVKESVKVGDGIDITLNPKVNFE